MTKASSGTSISHFCHHEPFTALTALPFTLKRPFTGVIRVFSGDSQLLQPLWQVIEPYCFTPARQVAAAL